MAHWKKTLYHVQVDAALTNQSDGGRSVLLQKESRVAPKYFLYAATFGNTSFMLLPSVFLLCALPLFETLSLTPHRTHLCGLHKDFLRITRIRETTRIPEHETNNLPKGRLIKAKPSSLVPNDGIPLGVTAAVLAAKHPLDELLARFDRAVAVGAPLVSRRMTWRGPPRLDDIRRHEKLQLLDEGGVDRHQHLRDR